MTSNHEPEYAASEGHRVERFADRHIGPSGDEVASMLDVLGHDSLEALTDAAVPASIRMRDELRLPAAVSEAAVLDELRALAARNTVRRPLIGLGYYGTHTPGVIRRNVLENPGWYTAYTPYQPEISQGRLEALLNFQTMVADLSGLDLANASVLDEATAAAEAMTLLRRASRAAAGAAFVVDADVLPQTIAVVRTRAGAMASRSSSTTPVAVCRTATCSASCCSTRAPAAGSGTTRRWSPRRTSEGHWSPPPPTCSR
jgi:glycine dehydrogenase